VAREASSWRTGLDLAAPGGSGDEEEDKSGIYRNELVPGGLDLSLRSGNRRRGRSLTPEGE